MKICKIFFNESNFGTFRIIFSFISTGKACLNFGLICKNVFSEFQRMIRISSHLPYRLAFVNRNYDFIIGKNQKDKSYKLRLVNIFNPSPNCPLSFTLDKDLYCTTFKEFSKDLKKVKKVKILLEILEDINKRNGNVAMISGSFCVLHLLKEKNFYKHSKKVRKMFNFKCGPNCVIDAKYSNLPIHRCVDPSIKTANDHYFQQIVEKLFNKHDVDVFLLGENKIKICEEILMKFYQNTIGKCEFEGKFFVRSRIGCCDVYELSKYEKYKNYPSAPQRIYSEHSKFFQIILKENTLFPNDIFSFFDLDCCKVGFFPGTNKVVASPRFISSICRFVNIADLQEKKVSSRHKDRILKYFYRLGVRTSIGIPHPMSLFHYFKPIQTEKQYKRILFSMGKWGNFYLNKRNKVVQNIYDVDKSCKMYRFANDFSRIPNEDEKKINHDQYTPTNEFVLAEKLIKFELIPLLLMGKMPRDHLNLSKESIKFIRKNFKIGVSDFRYYFKAFGISKNIKNVYDYGKKIHPKRVKSLLVYDRLTKNFVPKFILRKQNKKRKKICVFCKKKQKPPMEKFKFCSLCLFVCYCCKKCQKRDWKRHKKECSNLSEK